MCTCSIFPEGGTRLISFVSNETVAILKASNVKRHHNTKHDQFEQYYPKNTEIRTTKLNNLKSSYQATSRIIVKSITFSTISTLKNSHRSKLCNEHLLHFLLLSTLSVYTQLATNSKYHFSHLYRNSVHVRGSGVFVLKYHHLYILAEVTSKTYI